MATKTLKKTNTTKKTVEKKVNEDSKVITNDIQKEVIEEVKEVKNIKEFQNEDLITCRSVTQGELLFPSKKTGNLYIWSNYGDVTEVTYQDLFSLKINKSNYIYKPLFIIEDEDLLENPRWNDLKDFYNSLFDADDINELINIDNTNFEEVFTKLPSGLQDAVKIEVATRIEDGTFDSIQKIRIIDRVCNCDLMCLLNE